MKLIVAIPAILSAALLGTGNAAIIKGSSHTVSHFGQEPSRQSTSASPSEDDLTAFLQKNTHVQPTFAENPELLSDVIAFRAAHKKVTAATAQSLKKHLQVVIGGVSGTILGALAGGALGGFQAQWVLLGGASGGLAGGVLGWLTPWHMAESSAEAKREPDAPEYEVAEQKPPNATNVTINTTELPEPTIEKMRQLALTAAALSDYEQERAEKNGNGTEKEIEKAAENKALKVVRDLEDRIVKRNKTGAKEPMEESEGDFEDTQEVLSQGDTAEMVTAETAAANNAVVTANDLARVSGGGRGKRMRGEDLGPAGDEESYQGDMVPGDKKQLELFQTITSRFGTHYRANQTPGVAAGVAWKDGKIKFCFASDVPSSVKHIFLAACRQYQKAVPCLSFVDVGLESGSSTSPDAEQKCKESPAIFVQSNPMEGCYSYVGMIDFMQSQKLQLQDPGCISVGTAIHELGHAMGMAHEQSRPDRSKFVKIHWDNIQQGMTHNFDIAENGYVGEPYDFMSIMHYDRFAFSADPDKPTIDFMGAGVHDELGQRAGLSKYDVSQVVAMYKDTDRDCTGSALAGMGCVNKPDEHGHEMCNITKCNSKAASHCCACGGGVAVQCYEGQACPKSAPLPDLDADECIQDATNLFPDAGVPCVYTNVCKFDVAFTCSGGCANTASPKNYEATQCNGQFVTDICLAKDKCSVKKIG